MSLLSRAFSSVAQAPKGVLKVFYSTPTVSVKPVSLFSGAQVVGSQRGCTSISASPLMTYPIQAPKIRAIEVENQRKTVIDFLETIKQKYQTPEAPKETIMMTSILRKRKLKMNKHKYKKLRKNTRALRKRLGK
ncbi:hypothetical protein K7432_009635 [Basidiobolus ranarum]|uniref:Small ribosomal subunit protein mS38 n=1 Tax=Basidiobolus ranarum TaxID=34480 RepID=A0ABR2WPX7_9FUNG